MLSKRVRMKRVLTPTRYLFDPQLSWRKIFGHVIPRSREKTCLSSKFYIILNVIPSDIKVRSLMNSEKWLMMKSKVAHRGHAIHFSNSIYRAIFCNGNCTECQFGLKSQVWFQTKIARHQVQLPLYYNHFEIAQIQDLVSSNIFYWCSTEPVWTFLGEKERVKKQKLQNLPQILLVFHFPAIWSVTVNKP